MTNHVYKKLSQSKSFLGIIALAAMSLFFIGWQGHKAEATSGDADYTRQASSMLKASESISKPEAIKSQHVEKVRAPQNINDLVEVFYINLPKHTKRNRILGASLSAKGLNAKRFNAIEGHRLDIEQMRSDGVIDQKIYEALRPLSDWSWGGSQKNKLSRGQLGCMLSHLSIWGGQVLQKKPYVLILEDDVQLPDNFKDILKQVLEQMEATDFDIVQLSGAENQRLCQQKKFKFMHKRICQGSMHPQRKLTQEARIQSARFSVGTWAYVIKVNQIPKVMKHFSLPLLRQPHTIPQHSPITYWAPLDMMIWLLEDVSIGTWYPYVIDKEHTTSFIENTSSSSV